MPIYVKSHVRAGHTVKSYIKSGPHRGFNGYAVLSKTGGVRNLEHVFKTQAEATIAKGRYRRGNQKSLPGQKSTFFVKQHWGKIYGKK